LTPPVEGADFRAALVASCFRGAFPPVDLRAVCLVRAITQVVWSREVLNWKMRRFISLAFWELKFLRAEN
jgi:histone H3